MGMKVSWVAIKGKKSIDILSELGLEICDEYFPYLIYNQKDNISAIMLPKKWYLVVINKCESRYITEKKLKKLSINCEVMACTLTEKSMYIKLQLWENMEQIWEISHAGDNGILDVEIKGNLPKPFAIIKKEILAKQQLYSSDVDYIFEVISLLAQEYIGYKYDDGILEDPLLEWSELIIKQ